MVGFRVVAGLALAILLAGFGCSRPEVIRTDSDSPHTEVADSRLQAGASTRPELSRAAEHRQQIADPMEQSGSLPGNLQRVPAGTLLTVRLKTPVYASSSPSEASFEAVVEQPVVVDGNTIIPRGASVAGRVESAQTSKIKPDRGYVRLALQSVELGDRRWPVQTASLFAHEAPLGDAPISLIHLEKGRRLTFRVIDNTEASNQPLQGTR